MPTRNHSAVVVTLIIASIVGGAAACGAASPTNPQQPIASLDAPPAGWPTVAQAQAQSQRQPQDQPMTTVAPAATPAARTNATCAADASWVTQIGGARPMKSTLMRFDAMRQRGGFGPDGPVQTFNEFGSVRRSSEEKYEFKPASIYDSPLQLVVLRNASGPLPSSYAQSTPVTLSPNGGVIEYPATSAKNPFFQQPTHSLFVFPGSGPDAAATWVRMEGAMAARFRPAFAATGTPPPIPAIDADVAWEVCGAIDPNELSLPFDRWVIPHDRVAARLFASHRDVELVYSFPSPALATRAASEQAARCSNGQCPWLLKSPSSTSPVEGSFVRYGTRVHTAPTTARAADIKIASVTLPLAALPLNAPVVPGAPPSGIYQSFVEVRSDTCPTNSAGRKFSSSMDLVLMTHRNGKTFTELSPGQPTNAFSGPPILVGSRMENVEVAAGKSVSKDSKHLCDKYTMTHTVTVLEVTGDTIKIRDESRYVGSTKGCRHPNLPSNCAHEAIITYRLARKSCDARCDAKEDGQMQYVEGGPAPHVDVKCMCP